MRSGRERAYEHLRARLLHDPTLAGTFINEQAVADELDISRTPVREALLLLSAEGLVQLLPNRGALVPAMTPEEIRHTLQAREMVEVWAIREVLSAQRAPIGRMQEFLDRQRALLPDGSFVEFIEVDRDFHTALIASVDNPVIEALYETLRARHVTIGVAALERHSQRRERVLVEHQAIVDALAAGQVARAERAMRSHLDATRAMLVR